MKILFKSNSNALHKIYLRLGFSQTMNYTQVILAEKNQNKVNEARELIANAIKLLDSIV